MDSGWTLQALQTAADALSSGDDLEAVRAFQAAQDALDTAKAARLASIELSRSYEFEGASSLNGGSGASCGSAPNKPPPWSGCLTRSPSYRLLPLRPKPVRSVPTMLRRFPLRAERVGGAPTYGIKHIGAEVIAESEPWLLDVARANEPAELFRVARALREAIYPDDLDKAWAEGMDRQDIQVNPVPDGWHVTGFLSAVTGAKFKAVLDSVSKPTDPDDTRTGAQRRIDGLDAV